MLGEDELARRRSRGRGYLVVAICSTALSERVHGVQGFQQARRARCFQKMTFHVLRLHIRSLDEIENFFKKISTGLLARLIISKSRGTIFVT